MQRTRVLLFIFREHDFLLGQVNAGMKAAKPENAGEAVEEREPGRHGGKENAIDTLGGQNDFQIAREGTQFT